jgi:subtilisin family serine protease
MWFSNIGANVGLTAPGRWIFSLYSRDSEWTGPTFRKKDLCYALDGTSFAAPYVTGVASLLLTKNTQLTNQDIEDLLLDTAVDLEEKGWDQYTGAGLLNATSALSSIGKKLLTLRFMDLVVNRGEKKEVVSIDLFGIVRGNLASYKVELAKGKKQPTDWQNIFESTKPTDESGFICSIDGKKVERGQDWSVKITAQDKDGNIKIAKMWFSVGNK